MCEPELAHSMGGLVAQAAIVQDAELTKRIRHLFLFGTPSGGLRKASGVAWLLGPLIGIQVHNMAEGGEFISELRSRWERSVGKQPPFKLHVIAGDRDQFVPPGSALKPFPAEFHRVVSGDHLSISEP